MRRVGMVTSLSCSYGARAGVTRAMLEQMQSVEFLQVGRISTGQSNYGVVRQNPSPPSATAEIVNVSASVTSEKRKPFANAKPLGDRKMPS